MNKENRFLKKGISLIVLIITIAVMLILLTTIVISVNSAVNNAKLSSFATDLSTVEDLTKTYYMQNGSYPTAVENEEASSQGTILGIVGDDNKNSFTDELKSNGDYNDSDDLGVFYKIDLSKLDVDSSKRGTAKDGNTSDVYVVSAATNNIYYLKGINVKKQMYFSLSAKLTNKVKINGNTVNEDSNQTSIQSIDGLTIKKITKGWTNNIGIYVQANLAAGETLSLQASGVDGKKTLVTNEGNNEFSFNDLSEVNGFSTDDSNNFKNSEQKNKKLTFTKELNGTELGKIEVDMSNYETVEPTWSIDISNIRYEDEYNMIPLNVSDVNSGVKEVRYEYLTKFDSDGNIGKFYSGVTQYDNTYLKERGKKAIPDKDGNVVLKVDKDIEGIQVLVIDKAGNVNTTLFTIGLYSASNNIYEGLNVKENTDTLLSYSLVFKNKYSISSVKVSASTDGISYLNEKSLGTNFNVNGDVKIIDDSYENLGVVKYLKVIVTDSNSNTATRIFKLDEKSKNEIGKISNNNSTFNLKSTGTYYNPVIPKGFAPINVGNAIWGSADGFNNGLVITDDVDANGNSTGNEFVWVPIENSGSDDFDSKFVTNSWSLTSDEFAKYSETENDEFNLMNASVKKNGGFYIARYEACIPSGGSKSTVDGTQLPVIKSEFNVWNSINIEGAISVSNALYKTTSNKGVISTLIYARQWDAALKFIEKDNAGYTTSSINYGNYTDSPNATKAIAVSGSNSNYCLKNIYDMAGNVSEFTNEKYLNSGITLRGGSYLDSGNTATSSYRLGVENSNSYLGYTIGFRVALYINN